LWSRLAGGCRLDRRVDRLLERAGFTIEHIETGHFLPGPRLLTFHYLGSASRTGAAEAALPAGRAAEHSAAG
jgi:hypothetical protein